jgi:hypothetical protein
MDKKLRTEVDELAGALRENRLEPEQAERLRHIIRHLPEGRRRLAESLHLAAALREEALLTQRPLESLSRKVLWLRPPFWAGLAAGVALLCGAWLALLQTKRPQAPVAEAVLNQQEPIAVLVRAVDTRWRSPIALGVTLGKGSLELLSGHAQLDFACGATLIVSGPAQFELLDFERVRLTSGRVRVRVSGNETRFRVLTPSFEVRDLGTEFAVEAGDGSGQMHVLEGAVEISDRLGLRQVAAGAALNYTKGGVPEQIPARSEGFVGPVELSQIASDYERSRRSAWEKVAAKFQADPALVAHYDFNRPSGWDRTLPNRAPGAPDSTAGAVVGCRWVGGRWPGDGALAFDTPGHRIRVALPGEFRQLSLATWVRVDESRNFCKCLMNSAKEQPGAVLWFLYQQEGHDTLALAETTGDASRRIHYMGHKALAPRRDLQRWTLFVTTYNLDTREVRHFKNAQLLAKHPIPRDNPLSIGRAEIGNAAYENWIKNTKWEDRHLTGAMSEFFVLGRALAEEEVAELWDAGHP